MKKLLFILFSFTLLSLNTYSQLEKGKYYVCLDYCYFPCHGKYFFNFRDDNKCSITWSDDVSFEQSEGYYYIKNSAIVLEPKIRPDSIKISGVIDEIGNCKNCSYIEKQQKEGENIVWLLTQDEKRLHNIPVKVYIINNRTLELKTDSSGYIRYNGDVADSISYTFQHRDFTVYPSKKHSPSFVKIYMDTHYKDLFDRIKELKYDLNNYWYMYECDDGLRQSMLRKNE